MLLLRFEKILQTQNIIILNLMKFNVFNKVERVKWNVLFLLMVLPTKEIYLTVLDNQTLPRESVALRYSSVDMFTTFLLTKFFENYGFI